MTHPGKARTAPDLVIGRGLVVEGDGGMVNAIQYVIGRESKGTGLGNRSKRNEAPQKPVPNKAKAILEED